jgi:hypothetical protein
MAFDDVTREMQTPGFWIKKIENPDKLLLTTKEINQLNAKTRREGVYLTNIYSLPFEPSRKRIIKNIMGLFKAYSKYYDGTSLEPVGRNYLNGERNNVLDGNIETVKNFSYAMTVTYAEMRVLPTKKHLYSSPYSFGVDKLQQTHLDLGTPVVVLAATQDKQWYYAISEIAEGWVLSDTIAFCSRKVLKDYKKMGDVSVVFSQDTDIYANEKLTEFVDNVKMGTVLYISKINKKTFEIYMPFSKKNRKLDFKKCYVKSSDIRKGFLPYTQRNALQQAFKFLNSPYGWGGINGRIDCSGFLRQIYLCFGIVLPRNSYAQAKTGKVLRGFSEDDDIYMKTESVIYEAYAGITLLQFPGHVMLYLGSHKNNPYVIHALWGYEGVSEGEKEKRIYLLNRILVSGMFIGENTESGSLIERTTVMSVIK